MDGITWRYTLNGNNATIGDGTTNSGNATTLGTGLNGAITIPATVGEQNYPVTGIGLRAFYGCASLTSVIFPNSVTTMGNGVFVFCASLTTVTIPNSVTTMGNFVFADCANLTSVTLGNSVATMGGFVFQNDTKLTSINIPDSVTSIGGDSFYNTSANLVITMNTGKFGKTSPSTDQTFFGNTSVDFVLPPLTMTITSTTSGVTSGSTTNNTSIGLRFTSSASTIDFAVDDISVTNGTLSNFTGVGTDGTVYDASFSPAVQGPCTINVAADAFTAGGQNNIATTFNWTFDTDSPSMTITSSTVTSGSITNNASISLTFTSTEATNNFVVGDISVSNGALSGFAGVGTDGMVYTATFIPAGPGACTIDVAAGVYTDAATNLNNLAATFNWTFVNYAQWLDLSATSNVFNKTYVNNFIDLSGSLLIRNNGALTVGGDTSFNYVTLNGTKYVANDLVVTSNLFIGNDISINGNLSVGGDVSINNQFSGNFANNLIPTTAIENYPSGGSNVAISGNVRIAGDVSFNGTTVDLSTNTVLQVDDYITFNDGSIMTRHDDLKSRMFDMSASSVTTTTVTGVAQGQRILCSSDGKYVAINMGGASSGATNTTQSSTGIDISQDYGATFTRKYLNDPTDGTTPLYRPYPCLSISLTGQFMICCSYGATGHNVADNVIGFSNNYGATWSTAYLKDLIGTGTEVMYIRGVAISSDGATMIIDVNRADTSIYLYKTTSKSLSGFTLISSRVSTSGFADNTLKLVQAGGVEYIIAQLLDNSSPGRLVIYYLSSGTNLHTSTINYGGNTDISIPFNAINCIITGPAGQISRVDCREDFVYNQPNITDISNNYSPATTRMSSVQSPLGKHILIGPFINSSYNSPDIRPAASLRYSTNGGYRFKTVSGLVSNTFTAIKSVALSDRGHMYIVDDIGSGNLTYVSATFELMRDVTFKSVIVNGQATVAGSVTTSSDYRIKENVSNLNNNDTIDDLVPIQYNNILSGKHEFGLFAHELQSIYPELVEGEKDGAEYQRVDYNGLIGVLVKEVQDLKKRVAVIKK